MLSPSHTSSESPPPDSNSCVPFIPLIPKSSHIQHGLPANTSYLPSSPSITNDLNLCAHSGSPSVNAGSAGPTIAIDLPLSPAAAPPTVLPVAAPPTVPAKGKLPTFAAHPM